MLEGSAAEAVACKSGRGPSGPSEALVDVPALPRNFRSSEAIYRFKNLYSESSEAFGKVGGSGIGVDATFNPIDKVQGFVDILL